MSQFLGPGNQREPWVLRSQYCGSSIGAGTGNRCRFVWYLGASLWASLALRPEEASGSQVPGAELLPGGDLGAWLGDILRVQKTADGETTLWVQSVGDLRTIGEKWRLGERAPSKTRFVEQAMG